MSLLMSSSVTKQQEHVYDYVTTKPSTTTMYNNDVMDVNPAYDERTLLANEGIKAKNDGADYEVIDPHSRADDVKMHKNPAYAETRFS